MTSRLLRQKSAHRFALSFAVFTLVLGSACHDKHEHEEEKKEYDVMHPLRRATDLTHEYVAQVRAIQHIELRALERGYLTGVYVDEGQVVPVGHKMFQIMPRVYQAEVEKAAAEAARSEIEYNNTKTLSDKNVVSPNELALSKASLAGAKAQLLLANTHKGLTEIRAPFTGIMGRFQARLGSLIDEGDLLSSLSDNSTMWVYFNVAEAEYLQYRKAVAHEKDEPVKLLMANGEVFDQAGKIENIQADFDNETGTIAFRAAFPNPNGLLRHGETGKVLMTVPVADALLIPQKATFDVLDKKFVFLVDDKGVVHSREIKVAAELPQLFVVASGITEKDTLLLEGLRKVRDGSVIKPELEKSEEVLKDLEVYAE